MDSRGKGTTLPNNSAAGTVSRRVRDAGEGFWTYEDFDDLPMAAVAAALSRLARAGTLQRVAKGVYYRPEETRFGPSLPTTTGAAAKTLRAPLHPSGLTAANLLGLTTQNPGRPEYATPAPAAPSALRDAIVHTGRPSERATLSNAEGAFLETLRNRGRSSDLSPDETVERLLRFLSEKQRFGRVLRAAMSEPPRVRAMLGAMGQQLGKPSRSLKALHASLNPLSRFDFGHLAGLEHGKEWQAR